MKPRFSWRFYNTYVCFHFIKSLKYQFVIRIRVYFTPIFISDSWCCRTKPVAQFGSQLRKIERRCFMVSIFKQNYGIYRILGILFKTVCAKTMFWKVFCQNTECRATDSLTISSLHFLRELIQLPPLITAPPTNCGNPTPKPTVSSSPDPPFSIPPAQNTPT